MRQTATGFGGGRGNMKRHKKVILGIVFGIGTAVLAGLVITGRQVGWGPFTFLQFDSQERAILNRYNQITQKGEIVFYGASNFRLWTEMENDLAEYKVQNHGFGGSTDRDLMERAERLLYPYAPQVVVFQTGSNDYVGLSGSDEEKISACIAFKREMFETFHVRLPDAKFVVLSGLLLPGRSQYTGLTRAINRELSALCDELDYLYFVDAEPLTYDGHTYAEELFITDNIHLNHDGQLRWCTEYIRPKLAELIETFDLTTLVR